MSHKEERIPILSYVRLYINKYEHNLFMVEVYQNNLALMREYAQTEEKARQKGLEYIDRTFDMLTKVSDEEE